MYVKSTTKLFNLQTTIRFSPKSLFGGELAFTFFRWHL